MGEWHEYSADNIGFCQECKDLYDANENRDGREVEDYHEIVPLGEATFGEKYKTPKKKRGYPASLSDLSSGKKLRFNKDYQGNDQLGALEVMYDETSSSNSRENDIAYPASLNDLASGKKIRFNKDYQGNDQLGALEVMYNDNDNDNSSPHTRNGGRMKKRKTKKQKTKKQRSKKRRTIKKRTNKRTKKRRTSRR